MSLDKLKEIFSSKSIDNESDMVQSRLLSPLFIAMEEQGITQNELSELTGLQLSLIVDIFNIHEKLTMEHLALFQKALKIVLQPPLVLSSKDHELKHYGK